MGAMGYDAVTVGNHEFDGYWLGVWRDAHRRPPEGM